MQENNQNSPQKGEEKIHPSETQKVIEQHLNDENHEITDEQIRSVKVGVTEDPNIVGAELQGRLEKKEEEGEKAEANKRIEDDPAARQVTPWDTID